MKKTELNLTDLNKRLCKLAKEWFDGYRDSYCQDNWFEGALYAFVVIKFSRPETINNFIDYLRREFREFKYYDTAIDGVVYDASPYDEEQCIRLKVIFEK